MTPPSIPWSAHLRRTTVAAVLLALVGCGQNGTSPPGGAATGNGVAGGSTSSGSPAPSASTDTLIGLWGTDDPGTGEILYRFDSDGTYAYVGILLQARPTGTFRFQQQASGQFTVEGDQLHLQPTEGLETRADPDDPAGDYERPIRLVSQSYTWRLDEAGLTLTQADGIALHLVPNPE